MADSEMIIKRIDEMDEATGEFVNREFTNYAISSGVELNFDEFCFVAEDSKGKITGVITGRAYYDEVHIGDLIIDSGCRRSGLGSQLVRTVENTYKGKGYKVITLTTFSFQAPEFYKKLGYELEFVRENDDPKLCKYFFRKNM